MTVALILAIAGVATGVVALVIALRREWLERPRLYVNADPLVYPDGTGQVIVTVASTSRQPALLRSIGIEWDVKPPILPGENKGHYLITDPWRRDRLEPFGHVQVSWTPRPKMHCHVDIPFRGFAEQASGKKSWGRPYPLLRAMLTMGWQPPPDTPLEMLSPPSRAVKARNVEYRWKLWKPKHLRTAVASPPLPFASEDAEQP